jgi:hypothetical protein
MRGPVKSERKSRPRGGPEVLFDRVIGVKAPAGFFELVGKDPEGPEIQAFLNAALEAADLAKRPVPRKRRTSTVKTGKRRTKRS